MKVSLVISTYNWEEALNLVLKSAKEQSHQATEIIIADDGSNYKTKDIIKSFSKDLNLIHIWHKDNGFNKSEILNKAIIKVKNKYIIQIDGDIILHKDFIKDHVKSAKKNQFIHGSRVFCNKKITDYCIENKKSNFNFFQVGLKNRFNMLRSNYLSKILSNQNDSLKGTRGCNFSFWKDDFIKVNGYNEDIKEWGKEDSELSMRLLNCGVKKMQLKNKAICFHLHHMTASKKNVILNTDILNNTIQNKLIYCKNGIDKYF